MASLLESIEAVLLVVGPGFRGVRAGGSSIAVAFIVVVRDVRESNRDGDEGNEGQDYHSEKLNPQIYLSCSQIVFASAPAD